MGRSVSTPSNAVGVIYLDWVPDEDTQAEMLAESLEINEATDLCRHDRESWLQGLIEDEWDYVIDDFRDNVLNTLFPSVGHADGWAGDEDRIVAENSLAQFGVSEYCGLAALWVRPKNQDSYYGQAYDITGLALHWIEQAWPKVEAMYPSRLNRVGTFSNGQSVYARAST